jgi:glycosyltransferase involved in cell wall biosynthesis
MIERLVRAKLGGVEIAHVPMSFSSDIKEVGRFRLRKLIHLVAVIVRIAWCRIRFQPQILLYPPAGPHRVPMYRDLAILLATRWLFRETIFHFHAGGLSELYARLNGFERALFRRAYFRPSAAIVLSERNPPDGTAIGAQRVFVVPYGIEDEARRFGDLRREAQRCPELLFVGLLSEAKGILVLLEAARILRAEERTFSLKLVGEFASEAFERIVHERIEQYALGDVVNLSGRLVGDAKWQAYAQASIFCFPSSYEAETFGLVVLEAMQFRLPVVATEWRGVADLVREGETGFLVPVGEPELLAARVALLLEDRGLARRMGDLGREWFREEFTLEQFLGRMEAVFHAVTPESGEQEMAR